MISIELSDRNIAPAAPAAPAATATQPHLLRRDEFLQSMGRSAGAVVVTFKKRRALDGSAQVDSGNAADAAQGQADTNKAPRVYRVQTLQTQQSQAGSGGQGIAQASGEFHGSRPGPAGPAPRRRRVIDPARAPGKVTTEVFVLPAAEAVSSEDSFGLGNFGSPGVDSAGYSRVVAELEGVRATLRLAQEARAFRIL